jgi:hypothetical protein
MKAQHYYNVIDVFKWLITFLSIFYTRHVWDLCFARLKRWTLKTTAMPFAIVGDLDYTIFLGKMFKCDYGEINCVKCIVYLVLKWKDIILCLKFHTLDKHVGMMKTIQDKPHSRARRKGRLMWTRNVAMSRMTCSQQNCISIAKQVVQGGSKEEIGRKKIVCHDFYICYNKANLCWSLKWCVKLLNSVT